MEVRLPQPALMERRLEQGKAIRPEQLHESFERALREGHRVSVCFMSGAMAQASRNCATCSRCFPPGGNRWWRSTKSRSDTALP